MNEKKSTAQASKQANKRNKHVRNRKWIFITAQRLFIRCTNEQIRKNDLLFTTSLWANNSEWMNEWMVCVCVLWLSKYRQQKKQKTQLLFLFQHTNSNRFNRLIHEITHLKWWGFIDCFSCFEPIHFFFLLKFWKKKIGFVNEVFNSNIKKWRITAYDLSRFTRSLKI